MTASKKGLLVWAMAHGHDPKERHAFIFDRAPMPVNETRTVCGIQALMCCPDPSEDESYCVVCKTHEGEYAARTPRPSQGFLAGEGALDGPYVPMSFYQQRISTAEFVNMALIRSRIEGAVELFVKGGLLAWEVYPSRWRDLAALLRASSSRYQTAKIGEIEINVGTLAGRTLITFQKDASQVTLIGSEDEPEKGLGVQSIEASADEVANILETVVVEWEKAEFKPNPNGALI